MIEEICQNNTYMIIEKQLVSFNTEKSKWIRNASW